MKALLSMVLAVALAGTALAGGQTQVVIDDVTYSNISNVHIASGRVILNFPGGGTSATLGKLPADFLASWGIGQEQLASLNAAKAEQDAKNLDHAIQVGLFREVHGVVYDTRKPQSGWLVFRNLKVYQIVSDGALIDSNPGDAYETVPILVRHMPDSTGDQDYVTFAALPDGTYSYINQKDETRVVRAYDCGRICDRSEIPASVLSGAKAYDVVASSDTSGAMARDVVSEMPDSDDLTASGSGFFVTDDGYFVTNAHVVRNARRVKIKIGAKVVAALVVREDAANDLALLKVPGHYRSLCISTNSGELGESVFTIGFPDIRLQGTDPKYTDGKISSLNGMKDDPDEYQISVPVQPGNSGGPLVSPDGSVTGVIVARLNDFAALASVGSLPQNVNYAIKASVLRDFLANAPGVKLSASAVAPGGGVAAVQQAVAIVLVY